MRRKMSSERVHACRLGLRRGAFTCIKLIIQLYNRAQLYLRFAPKLLCLSTLSTLSGQLLTAQVN